MSGKCSMCHAPRSLRGAHTRTYQQTQQSSTCTARLKGRTASTATGTAMKQLTLAQTLEQTLNQTWPWKPARASLATLAKTSSSNMSVPSQNSQLASVGK